MNKDNKTISCLPFESKLLWIIAYDFFRVLSSPESRQSQRMKRESMFVT